MKPDKREDDNFLKQGGILAIASILVRFIGMLYRIPMANIIGEEGNGIYSAAYEIYNILLIISCYGMPMAVSKMVSARCSQQNYKSANRIFRCAMIFSIVTGGIAAAFVYFGADWLEQEYFSKYSGIAIPLRVLAPTILIVSIAGVLRGFFQGRKTMMPTAVSQIIEQILNAIVSVGAAYLLIQFHQDATNIPAWGAAGGTLGTCLGAGAALLFLLFVYAVYRPATKRQEQRQKGEWQETLPMTYVLILATVTPIILSQTVYQLSGIIDVTIFNNIMGAKGATAQQVSIAQGIYSTKYRLLVSVPIAVSTAISSSMIPSMAAALKKNDKQGIHKKVATAIKFNMMIAFPAAVALTVLAQPIIKLLFPSSDYRTGGMMLTMGSCCVIFYALSTVTSGVLQSGEHAKTPVIHSLISLLLHVGLVVVLLQYTELGVYSLVIGNVTFPLVVCLLNGRTVKKTLQYRQEYKTTFVIPLISSILMGVATAGIYYAIFYLSKSNFLSVVITAASSMFLYFVLILKLKGLDKEELRAFPMGRKLSVLAETLRLL